MGIFVGGTDNQYQDARRFDDEVKSILNNENNTLPNLERYGYGHSLGGNNITLLQLMPDDEGEVRFKHVYAINDAAPTAYQLAIIDSEFEAMVIDEFRLMNSEDIYNIPENELKAFAEEYYKNNRRNHHQPPHS